MTTTKENKKNLEIEKIIRDAMLPIAIIGCDDTDVQFAHFKTMCKIYEDES